MLKSGLPFLGVCRNQAYGALASNARPYQCMPVRTPMTGCLVNSSGPMGSVRVSTLEPTNDESILTTYVDGL